MVILHIKIFVLQYPAVSTLRNATTCIAICNISICFFSVILLLHLLANNNIYIYNYLFVHLSKKTHLLVSSSTYLAELKKKFKIKQSPKYFPLQPKRNSPQLCFNVLSFTPTASFIHCTFCGQIESFLPLVGALR